MMGNNLYPASTASFVIFCVILPMLRDSRHAIDLELQCFLGC